MCDCTSAQYNFYFTLRKSNETPVVTLTRNDELYLLRHGDSQLVGGEAAVLPLEVRHVPVV